VPNPRRDPECAEARGVGGDRAACPLDGASAIVMLARDCRSGPGQHCGGRLGSDGLGGYERGVLALELLCRAHAPALGLRL